MARYDYESQLTFAREQFDEAEKEVKKEVKN